MPRGDNRTLPDFARAAADKFGTKVLASFPEGDVTYVELVSRMEAFGSALQAQAVLPGDRVAVVMASRPEWMDVWFGISSIGAIQVPINHDLKGRMLAHCLADCGADIAIVEDRFLETVLHALSDADHIVTIIVVGDMPEVVHADVQLLSFAKLPTKRDAEFPSLSGGDPACIMYTSGTTGNAKGVVLPHNYYLHFGEQKALHMRTTANDRIYNVYPMFNASGQCEAIMAAMAVGASVYTAPRFSASRFWDDIREHGCTEFVYMGGILSILAKADPSPADADNPIRAAYGIPTPPALHRDFEERFGLRLVELYGSTEANIVTYNDYDERRVGSCGRPTSGYDIRIVDDEDNDVPVDTLGEIIIRPTIEHTTMTEYWNLPEKTAEAWTDGWYRSGDLVKRDADGFVSFVSRKAEAIRTRGYMINPSIVEAVLNEDERVLESAVVGIPDGEMGEEMVKAFLVPLGDGPDLAALVDRCARELPSWMVPRFWEVRESLPKTPTQKFAKSQLRDEGITADTVDLNDAVRNAIKAHA